jgi:CRP/FNR family transcriptional regulator, cyclic AMP receptor protein
MEYQELLTHVYLFRGASSGDLAALAGIAERKVVIAGDRVYVEGDDPDAMFLIEMGRVDVRPERRDTAIVTLGSGQNFGELGFFATGRRTVSAYAREPTYLLRIPFDKLAKLLDERPALALIVYRNACRYFAAHLGQVALQLDRPYF